MTYPHARRDESFTDWQQRARETGAEIATLRRDSTADVAANLTTALEGAVIVAKRLTGSIRQRDNAEQAVIPIADADVKIALRWLVHHAEAVQHALDALVAVYPELRQVAPNAFRTGPTTNTLESDAFEGVAL